MIRTGLACLAVITAVTTTANAAEITIDSYVIESSVKDTIGFTSTTGVGDTLELDDPTVVAFLADGASKAYTQLDWHTVGTHETLDINLFDGSTPTLDPTIYAGLSRAETMGAYAESATTVNFTANGDTTYELAGALSLLFGVSNLEFGVILKHLGTMGSPVDEILYSGVFPASGGGVLTGFDSVTLAENMSTTGSLTGVILEDHKYEFYMFARIENTGTLGEDFAAYAIGNTSASIAFDSENQMGVPEPSSLALLGIGVIGLCGMSRRRKQKAA